MQRARGSERIPKDGIDSRHRERAQSTPIIIVNGAGVFGGTQHNANSALGIQFLLAPGPLSSSEPW